jgi:hypothetical protein
MQAARTIGGLVRGAVLFPFALLWRIFFGWNPPSKKLPSFDDNENGRLIDNSSSSTNAEEWEKEKLQLVQKHQVDQQKWSQEKEQLNQKVILRTTKLLN